MLNMQGVFSIKDWLNSCQVILGFVDITSSWRQSCKIGYNFTQKSGPMRAYILARDDAITHWRGMMGPTKVFRARFTSPNTLRGQYGLTDTRNTTHGSDSTESAKREIAFFFPEFAADDWMEREEQRFRFGLVEYNEQSKIHTLQETR
ncbi:nucleoside diphosphate kinase 6-like isoform X2 [Myxocyprinus asiaticus]|uniref:nucleoside diphosphate kinase 6-like isoform X2 n=1 Tax=Myxocyprinus asiaticus TaxID=70543 RepID=UPI0022216803|nr:nucleoside diphosphate kinase 6-like isoform X2 [Myxocyprinus asiaticus]